MSISEIDAVIIRYADTLSPAKIAHKLEGKLTPQQVMARIGQLVEEQDWLTMAQQDVLVTLKMRQLVVELEEQPRTARNAEILIRALEAIGNRLDKRQAATQQDLSQLYAFQGAVMLDAIQRALEEIAKATPTTTEAIQAALPQALRVAQLELSRHEADPQ